MGVQRSSGRVVEWGGELVETGIFKLPVRGRVAVSHQGIEGDRQVDRRHHGGPWKAVYAYGAGHYPAWEEELGRELPYGAFGENLTIDGLNEGEVGVGDRFTVGSVELEATQPRQPCFKLGIRLEDPHLPRRFLRAGRPGVYFRVVREGELGEGDPVRCVYREPLRVPVAALFALLIGEEDRESTEAGVSAGTQAGGDELAEKALRIAALPPNWRERLERRSRGGR